MPCQAPLCLGHRVLARLKGGSACFRQSIGCVCIFYSAAGMVCWSGSWLGSSSLVQARFSKRFCTFFCVFFVVWAPQRPKIERRAQNSTPTSGFGTPTATPEKRPKKKPHFSAPKPRQRRTFPRQSGAVQWCVFRSPGFQDF